MATKTFLKYFFKENLSSHLCDKIRELRHENMDVEAYASRMLSLRQRVEEPLRPSIKQIEHFFYQGIEPQLSCYSKHKKSGNHDQFDSLIKQTKKAGRRAKEKSDKTNGKKPKCLDTESLNSSLKAQKVRKKTRKRKDTQK